MTDEERAQIAECCEELDRVLTGLRRELDLSRGREEGLRFALRATLGALRDVHRNENTVAEEIAVAEKEIGK